LLGLAHGMLKHYQQSYDVFSEAISIDPTMAEFWYNHGLACHYLARPADSMKLSRLSECLGKSNVWNGRRNI
jgi:lipoprotein NlpI